VANVTGNATVIPQQTFVVERTSPLPAITTPTRGQVLTTSIVSLELDYTNGLGGDPASGVDD